MRHSNKNRRDPKSPSRQMGRLINYVKHKRHGAGGTVQGSRPHAIKREQLAESQIYSISTSHQMCNLQPALIQSQLNCAFTNHTSAVLKRMSQDNSKETHLLSIHHRHQQVMMTSAVRELFVVREPLARAVSIYYFWGELYKLHAARNARPRPDPSQSDASRPSKKTRQQIRLGQTGGSNGVIKKNSVIHGSFEYHGDETTVPPANIAMAFAKQLPYSAGMPAPSYTWSSFADSVQSAVHEIQTDRIMTVVTERLDESLVVASHYLGWSLADVVVSLPRKALSSHPKWQQWPSLAVEAIRTFLQKSGETLLYNEANLKLDKRIARLKEDGIDFDAELRLLQSLRSRVEKVSYHPLLPLRHCYLPRCLVVAHCCCPPVAASNSCASPRSIWSATAACWHRKAMHNISPTTSCATRPTSTSTRVTPSPSTQTCSSPTTSAALARRTPFSFPSTRAERRPWTRPRCSKICTKTTRCWRNTLTQP